MRIFNRLDRRKTNRGKPESHSNRIWLGIERLEDRLMLSGLTIVGHTPTEVRNNRLDFVDVAFSKSIDSSTFAIDDVIIAGPAGAVGVTSVESLTATTYRFRFPALSIRGTYQLTIGPNVAELNGDLLDQNGNGTGGESGDVYKGTLVYVSADTIFSNSLTIGEGDTSYDGKDVLIDGATVIIDGRHNFNSLHLIRGAVLTHSAATITQIHLLDLSVPEEVIVDATSKIDVSGKGYLPGHTLGNATEGGAMGRDGGSYGGFGGGGSIAGATNGLYGDYANPNELGSGGSDNHGGGLIRLEAGSVFQLDGALRADGKGGLGSSGFGAGSGGSIYVWASTFRGAGSASAKGGAGTYDFGTGNTWGAGGGGRLAIYADDYSGFDTSNITAAGGGGAYPAGAGTVYFVQGSPSPLSSPTSRQFKLLTPMTFDGVGFDVTLLLEHVVRNQPVEVFVGLAPSDMRPVGTFVNIASDDPWTVTVDISPTGLAAANYVAVVSTAALNIASAIGRYPSIDSLDGYDTFPPAPTVPPLIDPGNYAEIAKVYKWSFVGHGFLSLDDSQLSTLDWSKQTVILTHGWNDRFDISSPDEFINVFAQDFERGRENEDLNGFNLLAVDWNDDDRFLGSNPNGLPLPYDLILAGGLPDAQLSA